jgi:hypothetical protein
MARRREHIDAGTFFRGPVFRWKLDGFLLPGSAAGFKQQAACQKETKYIVP